MLEARRGRRRSVRGDLHLVKSATSAIDRGLNLAGVTADREGEVRPQGMGNDIGADEYRPDELVKESR